MSPDSELRIRLIDICYSCPQQYKKLAEWLGVYEYILPDERFLHPNLAKSLPLYTPSDVYVYWMWIDVIFHSLTHIEQDTLCQLINES